LDPSRPWYNYAKELISKYVTDSGRDLPALDIGCGVGEFMLLLRGQGFVVEGIDANEEQMQALYALGLKGKISDLEDGLPYPDGTFFLVSCLETIEHIARVEILLGEIRRVLRPKGFLLLSTPNFSYFQNRIHYLFGAGPCNESIHLRYFTRKSLLSLLNLAAFRIIAQNSFGPIPLLSTLMMRVFRQPPPLWHVKRGLESCLAYDFVYLAMKE
jgi:2-polyprenyl-3-methyl-5-hydroxy-6-metoxy-1,4-benzoquinol methylase